jgi:hypothetical protein
MCYYLLLLINIISYLAHPEVIIAEDYTEEIFSSELVLPSRGEFFARTYSLELTSMFRFVKMEK